MLADPLCRAEVERRLQRGNFRLLIAVDSVDADLKRIIHYVNSRSSGGHELKLVAVAFPRYRHAETEILVPETYGDEAPVASPGFRTRRAWDQQTFMEDILTRSGPEDARVATEILDWARSRGLRISWGVGQQVGSFAPMLDQGDVAHSTLLVYSAGYLQIPFGYMKSRSPFDDSGRRLELVRRLSDAGFEIPIDAIERWPSIKLARLHEADSLRRFLGVLDWAHEVITGNSTTPPGGLA